MYYSADCDKNMKAKAYFSIWNCWANACQNDNSQM